MLGGRVPHSQRAEDVLLYVVVPRQARLRCHDLTRQREAEIRVLVVRAGWVEHLLGRESLDDLFVCRERKVWAAPIGRVRLPWET